MKHKRMAMVVGAAAVLSGVVAWASFRGQRSTQYRTATVDRGSIASAIAATGSLNAVVTVEVGAQVSGNIKELYANFNTKVKKGQLVARIDPEIFQARVNQAQANVDAARSAVANAEAALAKSVADISSAKAQIAIAEANLAKEKVNASDSRTKYGRQADLFKQGLIATQDRDTAQTAYDAQQAAVAAAQAQVQAAQEALKAAAAQRDISQAQVRSAQAQVNQQIAALRQAQIDLAHTYIYAPVDGTVIARKVDVGQTVVASMQAPSLFSIAQDLAKMQVDTNVDEADVGRVQVGQKVTFTVDAYPGRKFHGIVSEIRKAPINVQNVITYDVVVTVANPDLKLLPGMTANASILVEQHENALRVLNAALRFRPAGQKQGIYVLGEDGQPKAVQAALGITDGVHTEVTGGDLREGDEVITGATGAVKTALQGAGARGPRL